jgi:hypothetical protein
MTQVRVGLFGCAMSCSIFFLREGGTGLLYVIGVASQTENIYLTVSSRTRCLLSAGEDPRFQDRYEAKIGNKPEKVATPAVRSQLVPLYIEHVHTVENEMAVQFWMGQWVNQIV